MYWFCYHTLHGSVFENSLRARASTNVAAHLLAGMDHREILYDSLSDPTASAAYMLLGLVQRTSNYLWSHSQSRSSYIPSVPPSICSSPLSYICRKGSSLSLSLSSSHEGGFYEDVGFCKTSWVPLIWNMLPQETQLVSFLWIFCQLINAPKVYFLNLVSWANALLKVIHINWRVVACNPLPGGKYCPFINSLGHYKNRMAAKIWVFFLISLKKMK